MFDRAVLERPQFSVFWIVLQNSIENLTVSMTRVFRLYDHKAKNTGLEWSKEGIHTCLLSPSTLLLYQVRSWNMWAEDSPQWWCNAKYWCSCICQFLQDRLRFFLTDHLTVLCRSLREDKKKLFVLAFRLLHRGQNSSAAVEEFNFMILRWWTRPTSSCPVYCAFKESVIWNSTIVELWLFCNFFQLVHTLQC